MPFTITTHTSSAILKDWSSVASDRAEYAKFEAPMTRMQKVKIAVSMIALAIFSLGIYAVYLIASKNGRQEVANLRAGRVCHYVKTTSPPPQGAKQDPTQTGRPPGDSSSKIKERGEAFLKELASLPDQTTRFQAFAQDLARNIKLENIIEAFPFKAAPDSLELLRQVLSFTQTFGDAQMLQNLKLKIAQSGYKLPIEPWRARNPLDAQVILLQREEMVVQGSKILPADAQKVECLVLNGTNGRKFGLKIVPPDHPDSRVIVVNKNGKQEEVCIDGQEVAERWLLDKSGAIWCSDGSMDKFVKDKNLTSILNNFERLQAKQKNSKSDPTLLIGLIFKAFELCKIYKTPRGTEVTRQICADAFISSKGRCILAGFKGDKLSLVETTNATLLSKGGEAEIYVGQALPHGKEMIVKKYFGQFQPIEEASRIETLHTVCAEPNQKRVPGIQKPFHGVVTEGQGHSLQSKYPLGNLKDILDNMPLSLDDKLFAFYRLLSGLNVGYTKTGFIHGDLKLLNILGFKDKTTGKLCLDMIDFGSAQSCDPSRVGLMVGKSPWTPAFVLKADFERRVTLSYGQNPAEWPLYVENGHKWDVFALGRILAKMLVPNPTDDPSLNFDELEVGYPRPNSFKPQVLLNAGVPQDVCDLIQSMMAPQLDKRFDSQNAVDALKIVLQKRGLPV